MFSKTICFALCLVGLSSSTLVLQDDKCQGKRHYVLHAIPKSGTNLITKVLTVQCGEKEAITLKKEDIKSVYGYSCAEGSSLNECFAAVDKKLDFELEDVKDVADSQRRMLRSTWSDSDDGLTPQWSDSQGGSGMPGMGGKMPGPANDMMQVFTLLESMVKYSMEKKIFDTVTGIVTSSSAIIGALMNTVMSFGERRRLTSTMFDLCTNLLNQINTLYKDEVVAAGFLKSGQEEAKIGSTRVFWDKQ